MNKFFFFLVSVFFSFICYNTGVAQVQDNCEKAAKEIDNLYNARKWPEARDRCNFYLESDACADFKAIFRRIRDKCDEKINQANQLPPTPPKPKFKLTRDSYTCDYSTDEAIEVTFSSAPAEWYVSSTPNWLEEAIGSKTDKSISFYVDENPSSSPRVGIIEFSSADGDLTVSAKVEQDGIWLGVANVDFSYEGGTEELSVTMAGNFYLGKNTSDVDYISSVIRGNIINLSCSRNCNSTSKRTVVPIFNEYDNQIIGNIIVAQEGNSKSNYIYTEQSTTVKALSVAGWSELDIKSNTDSWSVSSNQSWCRPEKTNNGKKLRINYDLNKTGYERTADITLTARSTDYYCPTGQTTITVVQPAGQYLILWQKTNDNRISNLKFNGRGGSATIKVDTNSPDWYIRNDYPEWCRISDKTADSFKITLLNNNGGDDRSVTIHVIAGSLDESLLCNQTQRRNYVDYNKFTFGKEGGSYCIVNVTSKYSWNVSTSSTWCHISEEYKTDKSFKVYVDRNDGAPREATIIVYGEDMNETIKIYQE